MVDFAGAVRDIRSEYNSNTVIPTPAILPQFAKSVSLPENKVRPDAIRRCSIPYQTPSWDEPLDAVKVQFYLVHDSGNTESESPVLSFLNQWLQLVRAGRGLRSTGGPDYWGNVEAPPLREVSGSPGSLIMPTYRFTFELVLLKGYVSSLPPLTRRDERRIQTQIAAANRKAAREASDALKNGPATQPPTPTVPADTTVLEPMTIRPGGEIEISTRVYIQNAWLGGYKISDLTYEGSGLSTVDATFYPESVLMGTSPQ